MTPPPPDKPARVFVVGAEDAGTRLDRRLAELYPALSRSRIQAAIREGAARVDGAVRLPSHGLRAGEVVECDLPEEAPEGSRLRPEARELAIVRETDGFVVLNKPAGLVVHPAPGHETGTLANALLARHGEGARDVGGPDRCGIVHRLDANTTGLMLAAKTPEAHAFLTEELAARRVRRVYLVVSAGGFKENVGTIDRPIGRRGGERKRMGIVRDGREAKTSFRVLRDDGALALVLARLHTGRTHQIRVHFQSIGKPVLGDEQYGWTKQRLLAYAPKETASRLARMWPERQMLHAAGLAAPLPDAPGERFEDYAPPPPDMAEIVAAFFDASPEEIEAETRAELRIEDDPSGEG